MILSQLIRTLLNNLGNSEPSLRLPSQPAVNSNAKVGDEIGSAIDRASTGGDLVYDQIFANEIELLDEMYNLVAPGNVYTPLVQGLQRDGSGNVSVQGRAIKNVGKPLSDTDGVSNYVGTWAMSSVVLEYLLLGSTNFWAKLFPTVELVSDTNMPLTGSVQFLGPYGYGLLVDGEPLIASINTAAHLSAIPLTATGIELLHFSVLSGQTGADCGKIALVNQTNPAENGVYLVTFFDGVNPIPEGGVIPATATYQLTRHLGYNNAFAAYHGHTFNVMRGEKYGRSIWMITLSLWDIANYGMPTWNPFVCDNLQFKRMTARQTDAITNVAASPSDVQLATKVNELLTKMEQAGIMLPASVPSYL
jgi:hypothetical protein